MADRAKDRKVIRTLDLANDYLIEAADVAERMQVMLTYMQGIVSKKVSPPGLTRGRHGLAGESIDRSRAWTNRRL
ncbi:MAG: hypothetical protein ACE5JI_00245 [Acidobacteriota bacterium]